MDRLEKALKRLSQRERAALKAILGRILAKDFAFLNVKKLRGHDEIYRVRKGDLRVIYRLERTGVVKILTIERRSDTTYHRY